MYVAAALRLEGVLGSTENHVRLAVAILGAAIALFTVARAGTWPRLLYLLCVAYLAYFAAGSAWHGLWQVASVPADGPAQTLALALELGMRVVEREFETQRYPMALAHAYDLALMPVLQLVLLVYLARAMLKAP